jgi:Protein of unknown function (DUF1570)
MTRPSTLQSLLALLFLSLLVSLRAPAADNWVEGRSPHFTVYTPASQKEARNVASQFEQIRELFHVAFPTLQTDPAQPIIILAVKGEKGMQELLPEEWETKNHVHVAGLYQEGFDKHYVILQLNVEGDNPYHALYHEYTHSLLHLNFSHLPPWLDEGMAEYLGNAVLGDKESSVGVISQSHLYVLHTNRLIPIETLLTVEHDSPYYNESDRASVFYAESWALVHYLMLSPEARQKHLLTKFLEVWDKTHDQVEAARQAFGDLNKFANTINQYVHQNNFFHVEYKNIQSSNDKQFTSRPVSPAEVVALRGDFFVHHNRLDAGKAVLEDAAKLDPALPLPHSGLATYYFRIQSPSAVADEAATAIRLGDTGFFSHYLLAASQWRMGPFQDKPRQIAITELLKCTELNPIFAPADDLLSQIYAMSPATQKEAIHFAILAVKNKPGDFQYAFHLTELLHNNNRDAEAKIVAESVVVDAYAPEEKELARQLVDRIAIHKDQPTNGFGSSAGTGATAGTFEAHTVEIPAPATSPQSGDRPPGRQKILLGVDGTVSSVDCSKPPEAMVTLDGSITYHVTNIANISITAPGNTPAPECSKWAGRKVKLWLTFTPGEKTSSEVARLTFQ